jgi:hypothetical protein
LKRCSGDMPARTLLFVENGNTACISFTEVCLSLSLSSLAGLPEDATTLVARGCPLAIESSTTARREFSNACARVEELARGSWVTSHMSARDTGYAVESRLGKKNGAALGTGVHIRGDTLTQQRQL